MTELKPKTNPVPAAILETELPPERYIAGAASNLPYFVVNDKGDFRSYNSLGEKQNRGLETYTCTNFAGLQQIETQQNFQIEQGLMPQEDYDFLKENGYLDDNNRVNYSEKFAAIKTGTIYEVGNYSYKTPELARKTGLIPEKMLPFGNPKTWQEFIDPKQITAEMEALATKWKEHFLVQYETIPTAGKTKTQIIENCKHHLKQAPLTAIIPICPSYNDNGLIKACQGDPVHCILICHINELQAIFDSYQPFDKQLDINYPLVGIYKAVVTSRNGGIDPEAVAKHRAEVLKIMNGRPTNIFVRVEAKGEAYQVDMKTGSFKYKLGLKCPLFDACLDGSQGAPIFTPMGEKDWGTIKFAEIK